MSPSVSVEDYLINDFTWGQIICSISAGSRQTPQGLQFGWLVESHLSFHSSSSTKFKTKFRKNGWDLAFIELERFGTTSTSGRETEGVKLELMMPIYSWVYLFPINRVIALLISDRMHRANELKQTLEFINHRKTKNLWLDHLLKVQWP